MVVSILIPGITGTNLVNENSLDNDIIYSATQRYYETIEDLELDPSGEFDKEEKVIISKGSLETLGYNEIVSYFRRNIKHDLYLFSYDWRKSNHENGEKLAVYLQNLKAKKKNKSLKFNILTHSMGAFVFQSYLYHKNGNMNDIHKVVLTAPPFKGAIESISSLLVGRNYFINGSDIIRKIARSFPSMYELLPDYEGSLKFSSGNKKFNIFNPNHWQSNILESKASNNPKMFKARLKDAKKFRTEKMFQLDQLSKSDRSRILVLAGIGKSTKESIVVHPKYDSENKLKNYFDFQEPSTKDGDDTVHIKSASAYQKSILTLTIKSVFMNKINHGFFLKDGRVKRLIYDFLLNKNTNDDWWKSKSKNTVKRLDYLA